MLNNLTNFFYLIRDRRIKKELEAADLIAVGTKQSPALGDYKPTAITFADLQTQLQSGAGGVNSVNDDGVGWVIIDNTDPENPIVGFTGIDVDGVTITGSGLLGDPLVAVTTPQAQFQYEIGQYVSSEGGVIAHRWLSTSGFGTPEAGTVQNYLVLDTQDLGVTQFSLAANCPNQNSTWDGLTNTLGISQSEAADFCTNSTNNGKSDWYLPAIDELLTVYNNRIAIARGLSAAGGTQMLNQSFPFFSSTAHTTCNVLQIMFLNGVVSTVQFLDSDSGTVRAMRKFTIL